MPLSESERSIVAGAPDISIQPPTIRYAGIEGHLHRWQLLYLALFSALYWVCVSIVASKRLFVGDEIVTFYISRLPGISQIWNTLLGGADNHPPLDFVLRHFSMVVFGQSEFGERFPSLVAFYILCLCLFLFVHRRVGLLGGFIALLTPCATLAYMYAFFGRSYSVQLGCCGLALLAWQILGDRAPRHRLLPATLLCVSLALAISLHFYGIFLVVPILLGEVVRIWERRAVNWAVIVSLLLAGASALSLIPFIRASSDRITHFTATPVRSSSVVYSYSELLEYFPLLVVSALFVAACYCCYAILGKARNGHPVAPEPPAPRLRADELVCAAAFLLFPVMLGFAGVLVTHVFVSRYALPTVVGVSLLLGMLIARAVRSHALIGSAVLLIFAVVALYNIGRRAYGYQVDEQVAWDASTIRLLRTTTEPLVTDHPGRFLPFDHYHLSAFPGRLVFLLDSDASVRWMGAHELGMQKFAPLIAGRLVDYRQFISRHRSFLVLSPSRWLVPELVKDGARLEVVAGPGGVTVLRAYTAGQQRQPAGDSDGVR